MSTTDIDTLIGVVIGFILLIVVGWLMWFFCNYYCPAIYIDDPHNDNGNVDNIEERVEAPPMSA
jgi:tetrahydromethanopterin S-methyltransferase subunit G